MVLLLELNAVRVGSYTFLLDGFRMASCLWSLLNFSVGALVYYSLVSVLTKTAVRSLDKTYGGK